MAPRCQLRHRPGFPGDTDEPRLGLAIIFGTGITSDAPGSAQGLTTSLPCRETSAGGIRLPDWPGGGAAPRAAVAHGKHEEETAISSAQRRPSGAWSRRRGRRARRAHIADTALARATYDIDGGPQLIPTASE